MLCILYLHGLISVKHYYFREANEAAHPLRHGGWPYAWVGVAVRLGFSVGGYHLQVLVTTPRPLGRPQCLSTQNCYGIVQTAVQRAIRSRVRKFISNA